MQNVIYTRVSTRNQKDDLKNQVNFLIKYCNNLGIPIFSCRVYGLRKYKNKIEKVLDNV